MQNNMSLGRVIDAIIATLILDEGVVVTKDIDSKIRFLGVDVFGLSAITYTDVVSVVQDHLRRIIHGDVYQKFNIKSAIVSIIFGNIAFNGLPKSRVMAIQKALAPLMIRPLIIDGILGNATKLSISSVLADRKLTSKLCLALPEVMDEIINDVNTTNLVKAKYNLNEETAKSVQQSWSLRFERLKTLALTVNASESNLEGPWYSSIDDVLEKSAYAKVFTESQSYRGKQWDVSIT